MFISAYHLDDNTVKRSMQKAPLVVPKNTSCILSLSVVLSFY